MTLAHTPCVLVVDDTDMARNTIAVLLEPEGYTLRQAHDGLEALTLAQVERPSAILLDVMMPGMDGFAVCRRLRAEPTLADTPVILMSAISASAIAAQAAAAGATAVVEKPVDAAELRATLRACVAQSQATRTD